MEKLEVMVQDFDMGEKGRWRGDKIKKEEEENAAFCAVPSCLAVQIQSAEGQWGD